MKQFNSLKKYAQYSQGHKNYTGNALETVVLTNEEHMLEKNFNPVWPPGILLRTKHNRATTWTMAAMDVRIVDCKLKAK